MAKELMEKMQKSRTLTANPVSPLRSFSSCSRLFLFSFLLAAPRGIQDLSSLTKDQSRAPRSGGMQSSCQGMPGMPGKSAVTLTPIFRQKTNSEVEAEKHQVKLRGHGRATLPVSPAGGSRRRKAEDWTAREHGLAFKKLVLFVSLLTCLCAHCQAKVLSVMLRIKDKSKWSETYIPLPNIH